MMLVEPSAPPAIATRGIQRKKKMDKKQQIYGMSTISGFRGSKLSPLPMQAVHDEYDFQSAFFRETGTLEQGLQQHRVLFTTSHQELAIGETEDQCELVIPKAVLFHEPNVYVRPHASPLLG